MLKSGNREAVEIEKTELPQQETAPQKESMEKPVFRKPVSFMSEQMKVTSIKETLEKNKPVANIAQNEQTISEQPQINQTPTEAETITASEKTETLEQETSSENKSEAAPSAPEEEQNPVFVSLQDCWEDAVNESSSDIVKEILLKQIPSETENHTIEIEVPNELAKQEVREIISELTNCITKKTGISYSITPKVVKTEQEPHIDRTNPDEKFNYLCQENP
ncbi:MAG: hypothetical protein LBL13_01620, partial [Bacteroidales bacterium]|nr:hypothetical protein [Bacteroidales bacterium]